METLIKRGFLDTVEECENFRSGSRKKQKHRKAGTDFILTDDERAACNKRRRRYTRVWRAKRGLPAGLKTGPRPRVSDPHKRWILSSSRRSARKRGVEFSLEPDDFSIPTHCPICSLEMVRASPTETPPNTFTVDRIDSAIGYIAGNVEIICFRCNTIKSYGTASDHRRIADYMDHRTDTQMPVASVPSTAQAHPSKQLLESRHMRLPQ